MPLLIHGIVGADAAAALPLDPAAVDEAPLDLVCTDEVCAVVSELEQPDVLPTRANLLGHTQLLATLAEHTTVIPARFGLIAETAEELVDAHLLPASDHLVAELERLHGTTEWRLRGRYVEASIIPEVVATDRRAARLRGREDLEAKLELGERVAGAIAARRTVDQEELEEAVGPAIRGSVPQEVTGPLDAFTVSVLIAEQDAAAFDDIVEAHGARIAPRIALELIGPLPPFSFVADEATTWA